MFAYIICVRFPRDACGFRRHRYADDSKWLKSGLATRTASMQTMASSSNNGGGGDSPMIAGEVGQQIAFPNNQGSHLLPNNQGNNGVDLNRELRDQGRDDGLINGKSLDTRGVNGKELMVAPSGENSNHGLTFLENKRRRMGLGDGIGLTEENENEEEYRAHDNILYVDMEISLKLPSKMKNLVWRAGSGCLLTMLQLRFKHVPVEAKCPVCSIEDESILHALVTCPAVKTSWDRVGIGTVIQQEESFLAWCIGKF
ncbi:hypothetical protein F8388_000938 [Cannabis sativa]|uniref:Reverse transcriptase zinc-binding domain-containing protein n=1 Tax=Cannabis sativa TaxID=3483 RepID=A0A7J6FPY9_CANSA|nr:hypothetical protein F8388_000938 [Cannabis sativa]